MTKGNSLVKKTKSKQYKYSQKQSFPQLLSLLSATFPLWICFHFSFWFTYMQNISCSQLFFFFNLKNIFCMCVCVCFFFFTCQCNQMLVKFEFGSKKKVCLSLLQPNLGLTSYYIRRSKYFHHKGMFRAYFCPIFEYLCRNLGRLSLVRGRKGFLIGSRIVFGEEIRRKCVLSFIYLFFFFFY